MSLRTPLPLACLTDAELARVHGGGTEIILGLTGQPGPGSPVQGTVGLGYQGRTTSISGTVSGGPQGWGAGVACGYDPSRKVHFEGTFRTDGQNHEWGIQGRIRFLHP